MAAPDALVDERITEHLSSGGLQRLLASMWPVDCQTCGRPLGQQRPALVVDVFRSFALAGLYHPACRASEWATGILHPAPVPTAVSWSSQVFSLDMGAEQSDVPLLLLNPTLELVHLDKTAGGWSVGMHTAFVDAGLRCAGPETLTNRSPIPGAVAHLSPHRRLAAQLTITVGEGTEERIFTTAIGESVRAMITSLGGIMLAVTHAVDPGDVTTLADLDPVLAGDRSLTGWVQLVTLPTGDPRPAARRDLVLHHGSRHLIVGEILAHTPRSLSTTKAKTWAGPFIDVPTPLIRWQSLHEGSTYLAQGAVPDHPAVLIAHSDGWRLIRVLARGDAGLVETTNEARAWASRIVGLAPEWQPGPTGSDASTLYATS